MFCEFCGKKLSDDANFCTDCGNLVKKPTAPVVEDIGATAVLEPEIQAEPKITYEPEVIAQPQFSNVVTKPRVASYTQTQIKESSPAKTASICAIFAPVSILVANFINYIVTNLASSFSVPIWYILMGFSGVLCLGIYIGAYLIFTGRHRKELPFFLFLLAPGCSVLTSWFVNLFNGFIRIVPAEYDISQVMLFFERVSFVITLSVISYFIVRGIFKKILSKKE